MPHHLPRGRRSIPFWASVTVAAASLAWLLRPLLRDGRLVPVLAVLAMGLLAVCAVFSWAFVIRHARTRRTTAEGRYLMRSKVAMGLLFTFTFLGQLVPISITVALWLSVALFGWTAYQLGDLLRLQTRALREAKEARARRAEQERITAARVALLRKHAEPPTDG